MVTKTDLQGNVIWTNRYFANNLAANKLISGNGGRLLLNSTGSSNTPFISIDTLNGNLVNAFVFYPCPPNPQNKSDRVVALDNGITVKLGCDPGTLKATLYMINSVTGATVSAKSINNSPVGSCKITKLGPNSILLYGVGAGGTLMFIKISDPVNITNGSFKVLKKQLPPELAPDFGTNVDPATGNVFVLYSDFYGDSIHTIIKTDSSLSSFNSYTRPKVPYMISDIKYSNNTLYTAVYKTVSTNMANPMIISYNNVLNPLQIVEHPVTSVPMANINYPNRAFKIGSINSDVYFGFNDGVTVMTRSQNHGVLNCTTTGIVPAFNALQLQDSIIVPVTFTNTSFFTYSSYTVTKSPRAATNGSISCLSPTALQQIKGEFFEEIELFRVEQGVHAIKSHNAELKSYKLYDIKGSVIEENNMLTSTEHILNLSEKGNGMYFLHIKDKAGHEKVFKITSL
jgi:hypothetical protein